MAGSVSKHERLIRYKQAEEQVILKGTASA
jgi:hypothetical protein